MMTTVSLRLPAGLLCGALWKWCSVIALLKPNWSPRCSTSLHVACHWRQRSARSSEPCQTGQIRRERPRTRGPCSWFCELQFCQVNEQRLHGNPAFTKGTLSGSPEFRPAPGEKGIGAPLLCLEMLPDLRSPCGCGLNDPERREELSFALSQTVST